MNPEAEVDPHDPVHGIPPDLMAARAPLVAAIQERRAQLDTESVYEEPIRPAVALLQLLRARRRQHEELRQGLDNLQRELSVTRNQQERTMVILDHCRRLGAGHRQLNADRRALSRWFDADAMQERYVRRMNTCDRDLAFFAERLGHFLAHHLPTCSPKDLQKQWQTLELGAEFEVLTGHPGDPRVGRRAMEALAEVLEQVDSVNPMTILPPAILRSTIQEAQQRSGPVEVQRAALTLLSRLDPGAYAKLATVRIRQPGTGDDIFIRRHLVEQQGQSGQRLHDAARAELLEAASRDDSPFVRQGTADVLARDGRGPHWEHLLRLVSEDPQPPVRGATILAALDHTRPAVVLGLLKMVLGHENDPWVLRVACLAATRTAARTATRPQDTDRAGICRGLEQALTAVRARVQHVGVKRWAAMAREQVWCRADPERSALLDRLLGILPGLPRARAVRLPGLAPADMSADTLRVLGVCTQEDFGLSIQPGWRRVGVVRGHAFGFRMWRLLHEFGTPSPDKRQAFPHTIGRIQRGRWRIPSMVLAELAQTKVPGEPLFLGEEEGWRPYIPLPDDVLASLDLGGGQITYVVTPEGTTHLQVPSGLQRLKAWWRLSTGFPTIAQKRNWRPERGGEPTDYLDDICAMGFRIHMTPHTDLAGEPYPMDPDVQRFFPPGRCTMNLNTLVRDFTDYLFSLYENTLGHLLVYCLGLTALFLGLHLWRNRRMRRARRAIPLVLGGWGTRGKSGTERLKAAVLSGMGLSYVGKTTGCEAMFLYARPFGRTREMFLFRPYDKATIWEQKQLVCLAADDGSEAFLYECMALTPEYVRLLQHAWMQDDSATITNTYPDHEDLQGPAGNNIPEVMCDFIPVGTRLVTSEEQMLPILAHAARQKGTRVETAGWLEAGLIPPDILARFPYDEHPFNIALVTRFFRGMGMSDAALWRMMANEVIADLGVLRTYPEAPVQTRRLAFTNGMSANERFGCLGNWKRTGFADHDPDADPWVWTVTVVNNRADRIPRSRVFASLLVHDVHADLHLIIGGNLAGMESYIDEEWEAFLEANPLWDGPDSDNAEATGRFHDLAGRLHVARDAEQVTVRVRSMLDGMGCAGADPEGDCPEGLDGPLWEAFRQQREREQTALEQFTSLTDTIHKASAGNRSACEATVREAATAWFRGRVQVLQDYHADGDTVINTLVQATPPGIHLRVMGLQNIKGTGLGFIYRFQDWLAVHAQLMALREAEPSTLPRLLDELDPVALAGLLCRETAAVVLQEILEGPAGQMPAVRVRAQPLLDTVQQSDQQEEDKARDEQADSPPGGPGPAARLLQFTLGIMEQGLDSLDAVLRRRKADRIYRDLIHERIAADRAVRELQKLTKRQKGGWLDFGRKQ